jgi:hypothetical protein
MLLGQNNENRAYGSPISVLGGTRKVASRFVEVSKGHFRRWRRRPGLVIGVVIFGASIGLIRRLGRFPIKFSVIASVSIVNC